MSCNKSFKTKNIDDIPIIILNSSKYIITQFFRSKNTVNILTKNLLDFLLGYFVWYAVGWALCHGPGGNSFAGGSEFFALNMDETLYSRMFNEYVWAANAATIVSGALAERCHIGGYLVYTAVVTGEYF